MITSSSIAKANFALLAETVLPTHFGLGLSYRIHPDFTVSAGLGLMPQPYASLLAARLSEADTFAQMLPGGSMMFLESEMTIPIQRRWGVGFQYLQYANASSLASADFVPSSIPVSFDVNASLVWASLSLYGRYRWLLGTGALDFRFGLTKIVSQNTQLSAVGISNTLVDDFLNDYANRVGDALLRQGFVPAIGVAYNVAF